MSTEPHSWHFGFILGSRNIARADVSYREPDADPISLRGSRFCIARSRSLSLSFALKSSSTSLSSSTRKPPLELTILERSYSKYFPSRESRWSLRSFRGPVGELEVSGVTPIGRFLFSFKSELVELTCSRSRCLAFAEVVVQSMCLMNAQYTTHL